MQGCSNYLLHTQSLLLEGFVQSLWCFLCFAFVVYTAYTAIPHDIFGSGNVFFFFLFLSSVSLTRCLLILLIFSKTKIFVLLVFLFCFCVYFHYVLLLYLFSSFLLWVSFALFSRVCVRECTGVYT
jgi:hypothetical protein